MFAFMGVCFTFIAGIISGGIGALGTGVIASLFNLFGGWRLIVYAMLVSMIGILLYNLMCDMLSEALTWLLSEIQAQEIPGVPGATGYAFANLAGYLANRLRLIQAFSFIFNITMVKFMIVKLPFLKW